MHEQNYPFEQWIIRAFYALFFATPLLFFSANFELFEYNKMMFVYALAVTICTLWLLSMVKAKMVFVRRTPFDYFLLAYLAANIITTITSTDRHISIFGYYSRFNGGLLSTLAYTFLYFAFTTFCWQKKTLATLLRISLVSAVLVASYGVLQRLGVDNDKWVQDVQARVFSTLGQPNWLAAYLAMLIPLPIVLYSYAKTGLQKCIQLTIFSLFYLAFTFSYSRGGTLGLYAGIVVLFTSLLYLRKITIQTALLFTVIIALSAVLFGNALWRYASFKGVANQFFPIERRAASGTQLDQPGTESGQIRLIVWQGAWQIFVHNPIVGTGVETFANAYYQYRPTQHNQTTEWDFVYNKAHNEYLNELATKGLVGFIPYLLVIGSYFVITSRAILSKKKSLSTGTTHSKTTLGQAPALSLIETLIPIDLPAMTVPITIALTAGMVSYLVQNIFGFSVVIIALFFFVFPASSFGLLALEGRLSNRIFSRSTGIINKPIMTTIAAIVLGVIGLVVLITLARFWVADTYYSRGYNEAISGDTTKAYEHFEIAFLLNSGEPLYQSQLGYVASKLVAPAQSAGEDTLAKKLETDGVGFTRLALQTSPNNIQFLRTATKTYTQLATIDPVKYSQTAKEYAKQVVAKSPTDPSDRIRLAQIAAYTQNPKEAKRQFEQAISLKPDYRNARYYYATFLIDQATDASGCINHTNPKACGYTQADIATLSAARAQAFRQASEQLHYILEHIASPDAEAQEKLASIAAQMAK